MSLRLAARVAVLTLALAFQALPAVAQVPALIATWEGASGPGHFYNPTAIAVDPATGHVLVGDEGGRIFVFDRTGGFLRQWYTYVPGERHESLPTGILADGMGHVYVADHNNNCVKKYTADGTYLLEWGPNFDIGHPGWLNLPQGLALDASGLVYVADAWNNQVQVFTSDGTLVRAWGNYGSGPGQFTADYGIAVSPDGRVYVSDIDNCRVEVFGLDGSFLFQWGASGGGPGQFGYPFALTQGPDGTIYVSDIYINHRIQAFRPDGTFVGQWGGYGSGAGQFDEAMGLAVAPDGTLYVADEHNNRVQVYGWSATPVKPSTWGALKSRYR